jgi:hypothetical protein
VEAVAKRLQPVTIVGQGVASEKADPGDLRLLLTE